MKELVEIKQRKALKMIELMAEHGTKAKAEVYWDATEDGLKEIKLNLYSKGLLELVRATKTEIEILQAQAYGGM